MTRTDPYRFPIGVYCHLPNVQSRAGNGVAAIISRACECRTRWCEYACAKQDARVGMHMQKNALFCVRKQGKQGLYRKGSMVWVSRLGVSRL